MSRRPDTHGNLILRASQRILWVLEQPRFFTVQEAAKAWECSEKATREFLNALSLAGIAERRRRTLAPNNEPWKWESRYSARRRT